MASLQEIGDLLERIAMHYPTFVKQISDSNGLRKDVCEEWHRIIGYLEYQELLDRLDAYMDDPDNRKPPMAVDFKHVKSTTKSETFHVKIPHIWKIERGRLYDEEDREYVVNPAIELPFYWNADGVACQGMTSYPWIRRGGIQ